MVNVRICPKCKKPSLKNSYNLMSGWGSPSKLECTECGYIGFFYLEIDPKEGNNKEIVKNLEKNGNLLEKDDFNKILSNLCQNCGSKLRKNSNFCSECGFNIEKGEISNSNKTIPKKTQNCIYCGTKIKKKEKFCSFCGSKIEL